MTPSVDLEDDINMSDVLNQTTGEFFLYPKDDDLDGCVRIVDTEEVADNKNIKGPDKGMDKEANMDDSDEGNGTHASQVERTEIDINIKVQDYAEATSTLRRLSRQKAMLRNLRTVALERI